MNTLDWIIIIGTCLFVISGFRSGFIVKFGSLCGGILGIYLAGAIYEHVSQKYLSSVPFAQFILFPIIVCVSSFIIGLMFRIISKIFNLIAIIPGLKLINRTGGALLGLAEIVLILSVFLYIAKQFGALLPDINTYINGSTLTPYLVKYGSMLVVFLPESLKGMMI